MFFQLIVLKDTQSVWHAGVKAISYVCEFTPKPGLLKYVFLPKEDDKNHIFVFFITFLEPILSSEYTMEL